MKIFQKIFLITIFSMVFIFGMFNRAFGATPPTQTQVAGLALLNAQADYDADLKYYITVNDIYKAASTTATYTAAANTYLAAKNVYDAASSTALAAVLAFNASPSHTGLPYDTYQASLVVFSAATNVYNEAIVTFTRAKAKHDVAAATVAVYAAASKLAISKDALEKAKAAINPALAADALAAKTSLGGLQTDAFNRLNPAKITKPAQLISRFINMLLAFIGSISLVLYIFAGFLWMTASGNAEKVTKAKSIMVWTTLGVVVMLASYVLVSFVFNSLGL